MSFQYYQNPMFPNQPAYQQPNLPPVTQAPQQMAEPNLTATKFSAPTQTTPASITQVSSGTPFPREQSYIENILRLNKGKRGIFYFSFPDALEWRNKAFYGVVEQAGRDHLIIYNPETVDYFLLPLIYMDYAKFDEKLVYDPNFSGFPGERDKK